MRLQNRLIYAVQHAKGRGRCPIQPLVSCLIFGLLIAILFVLAGCDSVATAPIPPKPATIEPSAAITTPQSTFKLPLKPPVAGSVRTTPSLSTNGLILTVQHIILNPNLEKLEIGTIKVATLNAGGSSYYTQDNFPGGVIDAGSSTTFRFDVKLPIELLSARTLTLEIESQTLNTPTVFSVKATSPINVFEILDRLIVKPKINLQDSLIKFAQSSPLMLEAQVEGSISNPNPVDINFETLALLIRDKNGVTIPSYGAAKPAVNITGNVIPANSDYPFKGTMTLPMSVLSQTEVTAYASTSVQFQNNTKSINGSKALTMPGLASLMSVPQLTFNVNSGWNNSDPKKYYVTITSELKNDNTFDLTTEDFQLKLYNNATNALLKSATTSSSSIEGIPGGETRQLIDTTFYFLSADLGRKGFEAAITGDIKIGMKGVNEKIPVSGRIVYTLTP